jgi:hypothetical protein
MQAPEAAETHRMIERIYGMFTRGVHSTSLARRHLYAACVVDEIDQRPTLRF